MKLPTEEDWENIIKYCRKGYSARRTFCFSTRGDIWRIGVNQQCSEYMNKIKSVFSSSFRVKCDV